MQKTCKEIIRQAKQLAQCQNSEAFEWSFVVSLLNSVYSQIYNDLTNYSNSFVQHFEFSGEEADLPKDCYKVLAVYTKNYNYNQSSINAQIPGTYYIENNTIKIVGKHSSQKITVKYSCVPIVLTSPDDPIEVNLDDIDYNEPLVLDDNGFYYTDLEDNVYYYNFKKETQETASYPTSTDNLFNNKSLSRDGNNVIWNGDVDVSEYFIAKDSNTGADLSIAEMVWDNTHIAIRYNNNDLYVMTGDWNKVLVNPYLYKGRYFKIENVYAICGDDSTGKGILVKSDNKLLYIDFVPDTVLDYPNSVFFDLVEDRLALQMQAIIGTSNDSLRDKEENDNLSFYTSLQKSSQGNRIRNDYNFYRRFF